MSTYKDIDLTFSAHPVTGDVAMRTDARAVMQSIKSLVLTGFYEVPFDSNMGADIFALLFENADPTLEVKIRQKIEDVIHTYEPRADLKDIQIAPMSDFNGYYIKIIFFILNNPEPVELVVPIERLR